MGVTCCLYSVSPPPVKVGVTTVFYVRYLLVQIVYSSKKSGFVKLYVTATDKAEAADWVAALRQGNGVSVCMV